MEGVTRPYAEEALRLLGNAVSAIRLYPGPSPVRSRAAGEFTRFANKVTAEAGVLRFNVEPHGFSVSDVPVAPSLQPAIQLAETLHALQVGQLMIAPGLTVKETSTFTELAVAKPLTVRREGGMRARLLRARVSHIAVIEVSLRAGVSSGLLGVDVSSAPLSELASEAVTAAQYWASGAQVGQGRDWMLEVVGSAEGDARETVLARMAEALMLVDETTRMKILGWSLKTDANGSRMDGMLSILARMRPAALARLLTIVAEQAGADPGRIAAVMNLPDALSQQVGKIISPPPAPSDASVPERIDHALMAQEVARAAVAEGERLPPRLVNDDAPRRALATAVAVSRAHPDAASVQAIGDALAPAARNGAFGSARKALRRLDELACDPELVESVSVARERLNDPRLLTSVCRAVRDDTDAAIAGDILIAAGAAGVDAMIDFYDRADDARRSLMRPVLRRMTEPVLGAAGRRLRGSDALALVTLVRTLPALGDDRGVPIMVQAMRDVHSEVRMAAVRALADTSSVEARDALAKTLTHWDPETQRFAVREIGRVRATETVPSMLRTLEDINLLRMNYDLKTEIIRTLEQIGSEDAVPTLNRLARRPAFRRKAREVKERAARAVLMLTQSTAPAQTLPPAPKPPGDQTTRHLAAPSSGVTPETGPGASAGAGRGAVEHSAATSAAGPSLAFGDRRSR